LRQISHGVYQQALAVHVAGVGGAFTACASHNGRNRNRENLGHENPNARVLKLFSRESPAKKPRSGSITPSIVFFSPNLFVLALRGPFAGPGNASKGDLIIF
jgi:hypothetical protein